MATFVKESAFDCKYQASNDIPKNMTYKLLMNQNNLLYNMIHQSKDFIENIYFHFN